MGGIMAPFWRRSRPLPICSYGRGRRKTYATTIPDLTTRQVPRPLLQELVDAEIFARSGSQRLIPVPVGAIEAARCGHGKSRCKNVARGNRGPGRDANAQ